MKIKKKNAELYEAQDRKCFYCEGEILLEKGRDKCQYTEDHFLPKSKGYRKKDNIVLACYPCNQAKNDRHPTPEEWAKKEMVYDRVKILRRERNLRKGGGKW